MIAINNVSKKYQSRKGVETLALNQVSLTLPDQGMVAVLGPSGSGKSTLLQLLGGLDSFDEGGILANGYRLDHMSKEERDDYRKNQVGFVFQEYNLLDNLTIQENLELATALKGQVLDQTRREEIFMRLDLEDVWGKYPSELSGGQQQRVAIARALLKDVHIFLADEPTGALDTKTGRQVMETLKALSEDHLVILVTHEKEYAHNYCSRIVEIRDGRIISDSDPLPIQELPEISAKPKKQRTHHNKITDPLKGHYLRKMSIYPIRNRKVGLTLSTLLISFAFVFFALISSLALYDGAYVVQSHLKHPILSLVEHMYRGSITQRRLNELRQEFPEQTIIPVYNDFSVNLREYGEYGDVEFWHDPNEANGFYAGYLLGLAPWSESEQAFSGFTLAAGRLPEGEQVDGYYEIALTRYTFLEFQRFGYESLEGEECEIIPIATYDDLIGRTFVWNEQNLKVVGIIDTGVSAERYQDDIDLDYNGVDHNALSENKNFRKISTILGGEYINLFQNGYHGAVFTAPGSALFTHCRSEERYRSVHMFLPSDFFDRQGIIRQFFEPKEFKIGTLALAHETLPTIRTINGTFENLKWPLYGVMLLTLLFGIILFYHNYRGILMEQGYYVGILRSLGYARHSISRIYQCQAWLLFLVSIVSSLLLSMVASFGIGALMQNMNGWLISPFPLRLLTFGLIIIGNFLGLFVALVFTMPKMLKSKPSKLLSKLPS